MQTRAALPGTLLIILLAAAPAARADPWRGAPTRPTGFTVGLGAGWTLPAEVLTVDTASVRLRFPCGLVIEPRLQISRSESTIDVGGIETETVQRQVGGTAAVRYPVVRRGRADFVLAGGATLGWSRYDPWDSDNTTTSKSLSLVWGIAVDYWVGRHWSLGATASNPLIAVSWQTDQHTDTDSRTTTVGAVFEPQLVLMVHLYF